MEDITDEFAEALSKRYPKIHPLMFKRSLEKARSHGELFDILESIPDGFPVVWDDHLRRWALSDDLMQARVISKET